MSRLWAIFTSALLVTGVVMVWVVFTSAMRGGVPSLVSAGLGLVVLFLGGLALYTRERPQPAPGDRASVVIDWALTDAWVELTCPCSADPVRKVDGYTFGWFRCPKCGQMYRLPNRVELNEVDPAKAQRRVHG